MKYVNKKSLNKGVSGKYRALAGFLFLNASFSIEATPIQWETGEGGNGHYYEAISAPEGISWDDAQASANSMGGYLATITSVEENLFVFSLIDDFSMFWNNNHLGASIGPWLGGMQLSGSAEPSGGWTWVSGESFIYDNWARGEPNNNVSATGFSEDRIHYFVEGINKTADTWNDSSNLMPSNLPGISGYIVEYNTLTATVPEPTAMWLLIAGLPAIGFIKRRRTS